MNLTDLYRFAEARHYKVVTAPLKDMPAIATIKGNIGLDPSQIQNTAEEKTLLAHEVGHLETGTFYNGDTPQAVVDRCEERANRWAYRRLVPPGELGALLADSRSIEEISEHFGAPEPFIRAAYEYYLTAGVELTAEESAAVEEMAQYGLPPILPDPPEQGASLTGYGLTPPGCVRLTPAHKSHFAACLAQIKAFGALTRETRIRFAADRMKLDYGTAEALMDWYERTYPTPKKEAPPKTDSAPKSYGMRPSLSRTLPKRSIDIWK